MRLYWQGNLHQFICHCFDLSPTLYIFTKHLKVLVAFLRRLGTLIIIYLNYMLIIAKSVEETLVYKDRVVILLMQAVGFVINQEKSVMILIQI